MALARRWALNRESTLIGGGRGRIVWEGRFFSILHFVVWWRREGVGRSNYYTNRLKLRLSFPRIVDDYSPMVLSIRSSRANPNNVSNIAEFLLLP